MQPQYHKGPRDRQNMFALTRFCYIELFLYNYILLLLGPEKLFIIPRTSLCRGLLNQGSTVFKMLGIRQSIKS